MSDKEELEFEEMCQYGFDRDEKELEQKFHFLKEVSNSITPSCEEENHLQENSINDDKEIIFEEKEAYAPIYDSLKRKSTLSYG